MYSGTLQIPFRPDESKFRHAEQRKQYVEKLRQTGLSSAPAPTGFALRDKVNAAFSVRPEKPVASSASSKKDDGLPGGISLEDSALIALIGFLLCDNTDNDILLVGVLLYILLTR